MIIHFEHQGVKYIADLDKPIDISIPMIPNKPGVNCFYAPPCTAEPVIAGDFIGSLQEGGPVNFKNIKINPHGNGTHTECVEHISKQGTSINKALLKYHFLGQLITIKPREIDDDSVITKENIQEKFDTKFNSEALIIRTLPNSPKKCHNKYSGTNPAYCDSEGIKWIKEKGINHLLIDLPSVDKEQDEGKLLSHKAFWNVPENPERHHTITELIYVPDEVLDGHYLINIQINGLEMDATISKIVLFEIRVTLF